MKAAELSQLVKGEAAALGLARCGIAPAAPHLRGQYLRDWLEAGRAGTMGYLYRHVESRVDIRAWLPWAKSVIVVADNYGQPAPQRPVGRPRGRVAMYAWGEDYHVVLRGKLEKLVERLRGAIAEPFEATVAVDTSAILERELAAAAGVGWIGKNTLVMHEEIGSYFFLGEIVTDLSLAPDGPTADHCGTCTRCIEACPTQALTPYEMDARKCISYLTIEHRSEIDADLAARSGEWVFGCDVCQEVCPHNRAIPPLTEQRYATSSPEAAWPALEEIAGWDEETHQSFTRGKATDRARLDMWKRNAAMAGHTSKRSE